MSSYWEVGGKFPWVRRYFPKPPQKFISTPAEDNRDKPWVILPDGRTGFIHHEKPDGNVGVRPVKDNGQYFPNVSTHWSMEERLQIPEEISISLDNIRSALPEELPYPLHR